MFETPGRGKRITEMWAYICIDPREDCEGIPAITVPNPTTGEPTAMPLVGADMARMKSIRSIAAMLATRVGAPVRLVRFTSMEVVDVVNPESRD